MSKEAPWIALAIDWQDSEMLDGAQEGVRLAWICLLCFAKAQGRAGKVCLRVNGFAKRYSLNREAVQQMLELAATAGAITVDGDSVTLSNWKSYQDPRARLSANEKTEPRKNKPRKAQKRHFSKTCENDATIHHTPYTIHHTPNHKGGSARPTLADVESYCRERGNDVDPRKWFDHYEANGWMVGKTPMKNWKAAVRTWERNDIGKLGKQRQQELPESVEEACREWKP